MKFSSLYMIVPALLLVAGAHAQTRTAGGTLATQQTWSQLSESLMQSNTMLEAVHARIEQHDICAGKSLLYAPGEAGADAQGCKPAAVPASVTTIINTAITHTKTAETDINKVINCNDKSQIYDTSSKVCKDIIRPNLVTQVRGVAAQGVPYATATCPAGTLMIGCAGSRDPSFSDDGGEENHKFYGAGPISSSTCKSAARNGHTSVWAYCLKTN